jgi:hypothetical protein
MRGIACALLAAAVLAVAAPATALADGDPASDVLIIENVFYPYRPPVSKALTQQLDALTKTMKAAGFPLHVALIETPVDLGAVPNLFGQPQRYAEFLSSEITFGRPHPLLVVMPSGYGVVAAGPRAKAIAAAQSAPAAKSSDALAIGAIVVAQKLAAAAGHPVPKVTPAKGGGSSGGGGPSPLVIALPVALVAAIALSISLRGGREDEEDEADAPA